MPRCERRRVRVDAAVPAPLADLLYDPQTSGGLIFSVSPSRAPRLMAAFAERTLPLWRIGAAEAGDGVSVGP